MRRAAFCVAWVALFLVAFLTVGDCLTGFAQRAPDALTLESLPKDSSTHVAQKQTGPPTLENLLEDDKPLAASESRGEVVVDRPNAVTPEGESGPIAKTVRVDAKQAWQFAAKVKKGSQLKLTAEGQWGSHSLKVSPSGHVSDDKLYLTNPLVNAVPLSLIGRIGGQVFEVGTAASVTVEQDGDLKLRINEPDSLLHDNEGIIRVRISEWADVSSGLDQKPSGPPTLENLLQDSKPAATTKAEAVPAAVEEAKDPPHGEKKTVSDAPPRRPEGPPQPVPNEAQVKAARELVRQAYEDEFRVADSNPVPLIDKLLAVASQTQDAARKYAMLLEAEVAAVTAGDLARAMELIDARAGAFAIDKLAVRIETLSAALTPDARKNSDLLEQIYDGALATAKASVRQDALTEAKAATDLAERVSRAIMAAGKGQKNAALAKDGQDKQEKARDLAKAVQRRAEMLENYRQGLEILKAKPNDPVANGAVGRYQCFELGDWGNGLPSLAKGDQREIADIAERELKALRAGAKPTGAQFFAIAGQWWAFAEKPEARGAHGVAIKRHAADLYSSASELLTDPLEKTVAQKRGNRRSDDSRSQEAPSPQGNDEGVQEGPMQGPEAFHESMLGVYVLQGNGGKQLPHVNLSVPNGQNILTEQIRAALAVDTYTLVLFAKGHVFIPADGKYLISCNQFLSLDEKPVGEFMNEVEIDLKRGRHSVLLETRNNGGQLPRAVVTILEKQSRRPVPIFNSLQEINRFLQAKIDGQVPKEVSGWQPNVKNRVRVPPRL